MVRRTLWLFAHYQVMNKCASILLMRFACAQNFISNVHNWWNARWMAVYARAHCWRMSIKPSVRIRKMPLFLCLDRWTCPLSIQFSALTSYTRTRQWHSAHVNKYYSPLCTFPSETELIYHIENVFFMFPHDCQPMLYFLQLGKFIYAL